MFRGPVFTLFDGLAGRVEPIVVAIHFFSVLAIIFVLFPFHECAHALSAKLLGDETAQRQGRLTLNPFAHIDMMGAIFMFLMSFGWAKPVPVEPRNATRKVTVRGFISLTAAAGPVSNVILSFVFVIISKICYLNHQQAMFYMGYAFRLIAQISVYLAVFNLFPIPPLDGSKILYYFLKTKHIIFMERNMMIIRFVFLALIFFPPYILSGVIGFVGGYIMKGLDLATFFVK
ncbi:MAG: site-2 protease family protein [Oscillospiraceae bacterium]|jgi:Zn-dependent protease|nr:site-2 protease family protein [Oscillospiraceae bacterium]